MKFCYSKVLLTSVISAYTIVSCISFMSIDGNIIPKHLDQSYNENMHYLDKMCSIPAKTYVNIYGSSKNNICKIVLLNNCGDNICHYLKYKTDFCCNKASKKCGILVEVSEYWDMLRSIRYDGTPRVETHPVITAREMKGASEVSSLISLLQLNDKNEGAKPGSEEMKFVWNKCIVFTSEICRVHESFPSAKNYFYSKDTTAILPLSSRQISSNTNKNDLSITEGFSLHIPVISHIHMLIHKYTKDKIQVYQRIMLIKINSYLYKRECILINEIDRWLDDISNYTQPIYAQIQKMIICIMGGFYNLASVVHIKSAELVEAIKSPSMEFDKKSVLSYMGLFKLFEEDLMVPLIRIMDTSAYNAFLKLSTNYIQATVQLNKTYGYTELVKYDNALADFNTAGSEMSKSLALELPPTCRHGVISTNTFFKSAATKYKEI